MEAIRKGWDGAEQLAGGERERGSEDRVEARQQLRGGERQVPRIGCQAARQEEGRCAAA